MSSDQDIAIRISAVSKTYSVYARPSDRIKQILFGWSRSYYTPFHALSDVSFNVRKGESFGLIGRNGSGKSTLLQIVAGTLAPTTGAVEIDGRVSAMLELGAGFNPEFSGSENIFLYAAVLGLTPAEAESHYDDIVAFADIGDFINRPVKQYSSGMFMRLAFAVQAYIASDVIIIDEALAVGDVFFRQKCYRRLSQLQSDGATIVLVSHSMGEIEQHCERAAVLDQGRLVMIDEAARAIKYYYLLEQADRLRGTGLSDAVTPAETEAAQLGAAPPPEACLPLEHLRQFNAFSAKCVMIALTNADNEPRRVFRAGETAIVTHDYVLGEDAHGLIAGTVIHSETGVIVHGKNSWQDGVPALPFARAGSRVRVRQEIKLDLAAGDYTFEVGLASLPRASESKHLTVAEFDQMRVRLVQVPIAGAFQVIWPGQRGADALMHYGLANLRGRVNLAVVEVPVRQIESTV